jgi:predicted transcriptional regulator
MQKSLVENGAIEIDYAIMKTELNGGRIFNIWYTKILKEGNLTPKQRKRRLNIFKNYLYFVIFAVSPFASLFFKIKKIIFNKSAKSEIKYYSS